MAPKEARRASTARDEGDTALIGQIETTVNTRGGVVSRGVVDFVGVAGMPSCLQTILK